MTDEQIDVLDENGNKTGVIVSRKEAHAKGLWHQTADVWVYNSKREVLLQKRSMERESYPGLLDVSAAGHVSAGDTPEQTAIREVREELGVEIGAKDLKQVIVGQIRASAKPGYYNNHAYFVYLLKLDALPKNLQTEEVESVEFIPIKRLEEELADPETAQKYVPHNYFPKLLKLLEKETAR